MTPPLSTTSLKTPQTTFSRNLSMKLSLVINLLSLTHVISTQIDLSFEVTEIYRKIIHALKTDIKHTVLAVRCLQLAIKYLLFSCVISHLTKNNKSIADYTLPALCTPVTPFPPTGDVAYRQHDGEGPSHGHRQHAPRIW